ncbi:hypothetical protein P7K49_015155, partial [Saguinus oedipus]
MFLKTESRVHLVVSDTSHFWTESLHGTQVLAAALPGALCGPHAGHPVARLVALGSLCVLWQLSLPRALCGPHAGHPVARLVALGSLCVLWQLSLPGALCGPHAGHPVARLVALGSLCVLWQLSLDKELIDFGSYVVGETTSRAITLTNVGGLGTSFKILPASEPCEMDDSQSILKLVSVCSAKGECGAAPPKCSPIWVNGGDGMRASTVGLGGQGECRASSNRPQQKRQASIGHLQSPGLRGGGSRTPPFSGMQRQGHWPA